MADRKLFGTNLLVREFVETLTKIETIDGGWSVKYIDKQTNSYWLKYVIEEKGFFEHLMFISPAPTTAELIEIALTSIYPDEVLAAATRLHIEEQSGGNEFREELMKQISLFDLATLDQSEKERIRIIVQASQLTDKVNKRDVMGKSYAEVLKDAEFFESLSNQALRILTAM